jgi:hypothetical protein
MTSSNFLNTKNEQISSIIIDLPKSRENDLTNKKLFWNPIDDFFGKLSTEKGEKVFNEIGKLTTSPKFEERGVFAITKVQFFEDLFIQNLF